MIPGTFLFDSEFIFKDRQKGEKIFVVLNGGGNGFYIAAKATSRGDRYGIQHGCQILDRFPNFYFVQGCCFLSKNTWVQLDSFYEFKSDKLMQKVITGEIRRLGVLENKQSTELLSCASHSEDLCLAYEKIILNTFEALKESEVSEAAY